MWCNKRSLKVNANEMNTRKWRWKKLNDIRINYKYLYFVPFFSLFLNNSKLLSYSACRYCICCFFTLFGSGCVQARVIDTFMQIPKKNITSFYYFILEIVFLLTYRSGLFGVGRKSSWHKVHLCFWDTTMTILQ